MTDQPVSYFPVDDPSARLLPAKPEPIMLRPSETALIIVDMQNAYASPGGYLDLAGFDISGAAPAIKRHARFRNRNVPSTPRVFQGFTCSSGPMNIS